MEPTKDAVFRRAGALVFAMLLLVGSAALALEPKDSGSYLDQKEFFKQELYISSSQEPVDAIIHRLPNQAVWESYLAEQEMRQATASLGAPRALSHAYIDPRSGAATSIIASVPMIPGRGVGNGIKLSTLSMRLGREVQKVDSKTVGDLVKAYIRDNAALLAIDATQLGELRAVEVTPELWQVSIPQTYKGVPVRHGRLAASLNNGNLVLIGTETWGDVKGLSHVPKITGTQAIEAGYAHAGGASAMDTILRHPALEIIPVAPREGAHDGPVGTGYKHRLAWTWAFQRYPDDATWEVIVDAHDSEVLAFQDINHYVQKQVTGGVYPVTSTEICPNAATCGTMQSGWPMPFADTGLASPNNFTNSGGIFDYTSGTVTTTLTGRYVDIVDSCGGVTNSSTTGDILLGGTNGQHDCTNAGGSAGNTASSRSAFYEVNKLAEQARGWLPSNTWLQARLTTNVNINSTCNAFWNGSSINFYRSGGGCRNTGEIAGVFDHEWGHGIDDNDANGSLSNSSEAYADIAAIYRLQTSCVGHGFFWTSNKGCGQTADGTGYNANEAQTGSAHCDTNCSGVRDADYLKHNPNTPDTALGFVCSSCNTGTGPCGRQVHCAAAPTRQAAWDLVARDLQTTPFSLDSQTAFIVANRLFYQGSGNVGSWHSCTCGSSSSGCGSTNGYMQWLTADDDNGSLSDGTPHMTAIYNAFNRHGIACSSPSPVNSGCSSGPTGAATLSGTAGGYQASLSWTSVANATRYWVFRTEGHAGCNFGKTKIGETTGTTFTDTQVANGRNYYYNVVPAGSSNACFGRVSNCVTVTPSGTAPTPVTVFFDNFESSLGWTRNAAGTDTATTGLWERGDPEATNDNGPKQLGTTVSGVNDLVTGRLAGTSAGVHDIDGGVTTIRSPAIALPSTGTLTLSFSYYLAHGTNSSSADFLRVRVIGSTTSLVFEELGAANDDDAVWASTSANISSFAGQTVRIQIEAADASTASLVEAAVDDVRITQQ